VFSIEHYVGFVEFTTDGWLEKNKDQLPSASSDLLKSSYFDLLLDINRFVRSEDQAAPSSQHSFVFYDIFLDPEDDVPVRSFVQIFGRRVHHVVWPDVTLGDVLTELKKGRSHLGLVRDVNNADGSQDPFYDFL
jgi:hypothetical protein